MSADSMKSTARMFFARVTYMITYMKSSYVSLSLSIANCSATQ